ncbi:MAG: ankyrin repeat domain-containing protein [Fibromonadaceae bacterium]|jgi:ankyrin repeat protein|nr:ankyrin repeat domain-containing protein [Fibromonadaceae bacterium]
MLKKLVALGFCAVAFMACEDVLDPTNPESIRRYYSKLAPPVQMSEDQFVSYVKSNLASIEKDTANMSMFLVCSKDYLNKPNSKGNNALSVAVNKKNAIVVKYLLERGAEVGSKSEQLGLTPLEDAATRADSTDGEIFNMIVQAQKAKDPTLQNIGAALHLASRYGTLKNVEALVEGGANPNAKSVEGLTPLHEASKEGRKSVVEYLISKKVDINPNDRDGYTPLDWAEAMGAGSTFPDVAKLIQKAGGKHTDAWRAAQ